MRENRASHLVGWKTHPTILPRSGFELTTFRTPWLQTWARCPTPLLTRPRRRCYVMWRHPCLHIGGAQRYTVSSSRCGNLLISGEFNVQLSVVGVHVILELVTFEDIVEPKTIYTKKQRSQHAPLGYAGTKINTPRSVFLCFLWPLVGAYIRKLLQVNGVY